MKQSAYSGKKIVYALLVVCVLFIFFPCLNFNFLNWDDPSVLTEHPWFLNLSFENVFNMLNPLSVWRGLTIDYAPVRDLSYVIDRIIYGWNSRGFHLTQLLLHMLNTLLVFKWISRRVGSGFCAFMGALLFGVHPVVVEPVAWVAGRKDVLVVTMLLLTLIFFDNQRSGRGIFFGVLAMLTKYAGVVVGPLIQLLHWNRGEKGIKRGPALLFVFGILLACFAVIVNRHIPRLKTPLWDSGALGVLAVFQTVTKHAFLLLWPLDQSPVYHADKLLSLYNTGPIITGAVICLIILVAAVFSFRKRQTLFEFLAVTAAWPVLLMFQILSGHPVWMADRYLYFPLVGVSLGFSLLLRAVADKISFKTAVWLGVIPVFLLCLKTRAYMPVWKDSLSLWSYTIKSPMALEEPVVLGNYGLSLFSAGKFDKAGMYLRRSLGMNPSWPRAWIFLSRVYIRTGMSEDAEEIIEKLVKSVHRLKGRDPLWLGTAVFEAGRCREGLNLVRTFKLTHFYDPVAQWVEAYLTYEVKNKPSFLKVDITDDIRFFKDELGYSKIYRYNCRDDSHLAR